MNTTDDYYYFDYNIIRLIDEIIIWSLIPVGWLGLITNSLNIAVYAAIGFQDSVSVCFFSLSVCDMCFVFLKHSINFYTAIFLVMPSLISDILVRIQTMDFYGNMLFDISALLKTFIAVQRGWCVAFPFHVKRVFTSKRVTVVIICLCLLISACYVNNDFMKVKISYTFDNETYLIQVYTQGVIVTEKIRSTFNKTALICACEILIFISLIVIVYGVTSHSNWRQSFPAEKFQIEIKSRQWITFCRLFTRNDKEVSEKTYNCQITVNLHKKQKALRNNRELRAIKQVVLISIVHLICYTPVAIYQITYEHMTSGYLKLSFYNVYLILYRILYLLGPLNAALNFFIYYIYNKKFKETLLIICKRIQNDLSLDAIKNKPICKL